MTTCTLRLLKIMKIYPWQLSVYRPRFIDYEKIKCKVRFILSHKDFFFKLKLILTRKSNQPVLMLFLYNRYNVRILQFTSIGLRLYWEFKIFRSQDWYSAHVTQYHLWKFGRVSLWVFYYFLWNEILNSMKWSVKAKAIYN